MTDKLNDAIAEVRRVSPANDPWCADDLCAGRAPIDDSIATILNAVASGDLITREAADARAGALLREAAGIASRHWEGEPEDTIAMESELLALAPDATAALERALMKSREVKPLEWTVRHHQQYEIWSAGDYDVWVASDYHRLEGAGDEVLLFPTLEAAKAAAQADYAARITAALQPIGGDA